LVLIQQIFALSLCGLHLCNQVLHGLSISIYSSPRSTSILTCLEKLLANFFPFLF
jgi:hypothetical protein